MSTARINAIGLVSSDLDRTVAFYRALGCELPDPPGEEGGHLVAELGDFRLMIDTEEIIRSFDPHWQPSASSVPWARARISSRSMRCGRSGTPQCSTRTAYTSICMPRWCWARNDGCSDRAQDRR